jgi:hypothetical protein
MKLIILDLLTRVSWDHKEEEDEEEKEKGIVR